MNRRRQCRLLLIFMFVLVCLEVAWAAPYKRLATITNRSDVTVRVVIENEQGDYTYETLPRLSSMDLSENTARVRVDKHLGDLPSEEQRVDVVVRDAEHRQYFIESFGESVEL